MRNDSSRPWYRKVKDGWYAWKDGRQVSLGVKGRGNRKAAQAALLRLMTAPPTPPQPKAETTATVGEITNAFLDNAQGRVKPETMAVWRSALRRLDKKFGVRTASTLTPHEVEAFARRPGISNGTINSSLTSVVTCFRWAVRGGLLAVNPLSGVRKPPCGSRGSSAVLTPDEFRRLHDAASPAFRPFLLGLWLTGCRPGELARLTVNDVDFEAGVAVLADHKTAGKTGKPRLIFLSPEAVALVRSQHPAGLVFRNSWGNGWNRFTLQAAMERARAKAGVPHAICYGLRHSFATEALAKGVPDATVAALLGHSSTTMLHKHYAHLTSRADVLREAVRRVR